MPKAVAAGFETPNVRPADWLMPGLLKLKPELPVVPKPALRLPPAGLLVENPKEEPPVPTPPNPGPPPKPPSVEEPKLVPTAEAKGFPNPAPKGAWVPGVGCCCWVNVAAIATAAALGTLENGAGPVVTRGVLCHFLLEARLDSKMSVESSRKALR